MEALKVERKRIKNAWEGRISGCQLGKPIEILSIVKGVNAGTGYLKDNNALPLRDYIPFGPDPLVERRGKRSCKGYITRSEPDDDINYTLLALMMLEEHGLGLSTPDVAVAWLKNLPAALTFTAEKAAYRTLLNKVDDTVLMGLPHDFDLSDCSDNKFSDWIGAQIRADMYGWVCPGQPALAADLARRDASLSHRGDGIHGAAFVAALGAAIPACDSIGRAIDIAEREVPGDSEAAEAIRLGKSLVGEKDAVQKIHEKYKGMSAVHTVNNLALVVWGILSGEQDFSTAVGDTVAAGLDTDCNGATVGALWGLTGRPIPEQWTTPWQGRVAATLAGVGELELDDLVDRTMAVAGKILRD